MSDSFDTSCRKCGADMPNVPSSRSPIGARFFLTGYACKECGHFNDLKRRKGYSEWDAACMVGDGRARP